MPYGIRLYGALASYEEKLWPIVLIFVGGKEPGAPDALAQYAESVRISMDPRDIRKLDLYQGLALMHMDSFGNARKVFEKLLAGSKDDDEKAMLRQSLQELAERERAVASQKATAFSKEEFWAGALANQSVWVRVYAIKTAARFSDPRFYDLLVAATRDPEARIREAGAFALGSRGDRRAVEVIRPLLKDQSGEVRNAAGVALNDLGVSVPSGEATDDG